MTHSKKITITLSKDTMSKLKNLKRQSRLDYNTLVERALCAYIQRERKKRVLSLMREGYAYMGKINLELANECIGIDEGTTLV
jgi:predicted transcriptional regulator